MLIFCLILCIELFVSRRLLRSKNGNDQQVLLNEFGTYEIALKRQYPQAVEQNHSDQHV